MEFFRRLAEILRRGETAVLAAVIETKGSTPRETGAKMIVCETGETFGTIGGGAGEAKVIFEAKSVLNTRRNSFVDIDLTNREREGICGGKMKILLEFWGGNAALEQAEKIARDLSAGQTVFRSFPALGYVEKLEAPPILLIVGAGHIGIELAKIAAQIGFEVAVQDDRREWANVENYPDARQVLNESVETAITRVENREQLFVALLTRGFEFDLEALKTILRREEPCAYIGMIGSERRVREVFRELEIAGFSQNELQKIKAPIGLNIGALTPAEIAVSIAAELIQTRRQQEI